jgi:hemoglobin-like flavoprotein
MTNEQIRLVKNSWKILRQIDTSLFADVFYSKLFLENTGLRKMFPANMRQQRQLLMDMLHFIISNLDHPEASNEEIRALGLRHEGYGIKREHYQLVGDALLWTIEQAIGNEWNDELNDGWLACYDMISKTMMSAKKHPV